MDLDDLLRRSVALAATYRLGASAMSPLDDDPDVLTEHEWKAVLAAMEGIPPGSLDLTVPDEMPHVVRPRGAAGGPGPRPGVAVRHAPPRRPPRRP